MPESRSRKQAEVKKKRRSAEELAEHRRDNARLAPAANRNWVPYVFIPGFLLGVAWMVVYNLAGDRIGFMQALGDWNVVIGLGLIIASFSLMTLWK